MGEILPDGTIQGYSNSKGKSNIQGNNLDVNKYQITYRDDSIDRDLYWICECEGLDYIEDLFFKTHDVLNTIVDVKQLNK